MNNSRKPIILEYIWLDGNRELRSKYRTVYLEQSNGWSLEVERWNYDGSSTNQANTDNSEVILNPVATYPNPFFPDGTAYLVLCDTYYMVGEKFVPTASNFRVYAQDLFRKREDMEPWYGIEQEYFMMTPCETFNSRTPLAFSGAIMPKNQGEYYCGVGNQHIRVRTLVEKHYQYCLRAGLAISGINAEVAPNQWEFQVGPCKGIQAGDQLWVARYILHKLSEEFNVNVNFEPKPLASPWNGSGLHTNFSTKETRAEGGLDKLHQYVALLEPKHKEHIEVYGDNSQRLSGECETSSIDRFNCGVGNRGCSIRIPTSVIGEGRGYLEDRRPASNADPYQVTGILFKTCCLE